MSTKETGGPAFPFTEANGANTGDTGMTLRDYFAANYVAGYMANTEASFPTRKEAAQEAYAMADAMLKARSK